MKSLSLAGLLAGMTLVAPLAAHAEDFHGSDTLIDVTKDAIIKAGLTDVLTYLGGGSGTGEAGLINGSQGIAPMSRLISNAGLTNLQNQGVDAIQTVIGLDGVSVFVNGANATASMDIPLIRSVFTCQTTDWNQVAGSGVTAPASLPIVAYRRDDLSGTTDTFKTLVGITTFGGCVTVVGDTADIASHTSNEAGAIGYAGLSGGVAGNKGLAVAAAAGGTAVPANQDTIRNFSYPLARRLYINSVSGARFPSDDEQSLLDAMTDRSFLDPILVAREFITCPTTGCP